MEKYIISLFLLIFGRLNGKIYYLVYSYIDKETKSKICDNNRTVDASSEFIAKSNVKGIAQSKYPDCKINITRSLKLP